MLSRKPPAMFPGQIPCSAASGRVQALRAAVTCVQSLAGPPRKGKAQAGREGASGGGEASTSSHPPPCAKGATRRAGTTPRLSEQHPRAAAEPRGRGPSKPPAQAAEASPSGRRAARPGIRRPARFLPPLLLLLPPPPPAAAAWGRPRLPLPPAEPEDAPGRGCVRSSLPARGGVWMRLAAPRLAPRPPRHAHRAEGHYLHQDLRRGAALPHHRLLPEEVLRGLRGHRGGGGDHRPADGQIPGIWLCDHGRQSCS